MNENGNTKSKKEWIKNAAIVFLIIMLLLTLFSNTIMNYSLPKVSAAYVTKGTITEIVRGSGTVEAGEAFVMKAEEARKIESVLVSKGDHVEKGDVIFNLTETESAELAKAEQDLADKELEYYKALLTSKMTAGKAASVNSGGAASFGYYLNQIDEMQKKIEEAEQKVLEKQAVIDNLGVGKSVEAIRQTTDKLALDLEKAIATNDQADAQEAFNKWKNGYSAEIDSAISSQKSQAEKYKVNAKKSVLISMLNKMTELGIGTGGISSETINSQSSMEGITGLYNSMYNAIPEAKVGEFSGIVADFNNQNIPGVEECNSKISYFEQEKTKVSAMTYASDWQAYKDATERLRSATNQLTVVTAADNKINAEYAAAADYATRDKAAADAELTAIKADYEALINDVTKALDADKLSDDIERKKEEIEKLKEKSMGTTVVAEVSGTIQEVKYVAGESTEAGKDMCTIIPDGKDLSIKISVDKKNAQRVKVGDMASLEDSWAYPDAVLILESITDDMDSQGKSVFLNFSVTSSTIKIGTNLTVSMGSTSKDYDAIVPKQAVHNDQSGDFVYVITTKSSPLGDRYYANKVQVNKLGNGDDNSYPVSGVNQGDYVLVSSNKPVEAGKMVRLNEDAE